MKRVATVLVALAAVALATDVSWAQRPDGKKEGGERGRPESGRRQGNSSGREGRSFSFPPNPFMIALDTDKDGELSASEIKNAAVALKKLDKNNDGKLTREELRPQFSRRGEGERRPGGGGFGGRRRGTGGGDFAERLLGFDKNKDGKVSKDELPERYQRIIQRADTNKDGALDKKEIEALVKSFRERSGAGGRGRPGEGGRRRPSGEGGNRRPGGEGGNRPRRPSNDL